MGCTAGSLNQVHVGGDAPGTPNGKKGGKGNTKGGGGGDSRGGSASSKKSGDSGFDDEDAHEQFLIQRDILSRPVLSAAVPGSKGTGGERVEERKVLATLHEEGLIQRPIARRAFGVSFEVLSADDYGPDGELLLAAGLRARPPPRLAKLEEIRKKKRKKPLTEEQIREKLRRAEMRKKEQEQLRLAKIQALHHTDIQSVQDTYAQTQRDLEETAKTKEEIAAENREKKLKERLAKLEAKNRHAAEVRKRRAAAAAAAAADEAIDNGDVGGLGSQGGLGSKGALRSRGDMSSGGLGSRSDLRNGGDRRSNGSGSALGSKGDLKSLSNNESRVGGGGGGGIGGGGGDPQSWAIVGGGGRKAVTSAALAQSLALGLERAGSAGVVGSTGRSDSPIGRNRKQSNSATIAGRRN